MTRPIHGHGGEGGLDLHDLRRQLLSGAIKFAEVMFPKDMRLPTQARQGFGPDGRPLCFNAQPMPGFYWANNGYDDHGRLKRERIRWQFSRDCKSWVADPSTDPVPLREGWRCGGCAHFPEHHVQTALDNRKARDARAAAKP